MMRLRLFLRATSMTSVQYSSGRLLISSLLLMNCTRARSMPTARHTWW
jgi:hypothetical protein